MNKTLFFLFLTVSINTFGQVRTDSTLDPINVAILLYDGVELLDFAGPGEVFQQAELNDKKAFNIYTVGVDSNEIISQKFLKITTKYLIDDCPMPEILIIPGGNTFLVANNQKLISWIAKVNENAKYMLTVCNGVNLLVKTGALDGMVATSHYGAIENLIKYFPKVKIVTGKRFVDNGRIITTEGVSAGIDGSLYLLSKMFNMEVANDVAKIMMYNWKPETLDYLVTQKEDTLFEKRISAFTWMPDGTSIILNVMKIDKTEKIPPISKKIKFSIPSKKVEYLPIDGGGLAVSPDGNLVAYIKRVIDKDHIYLYDFSTKKNMLLVGDMLKKYALNWSPDSKNLIYNIQLGKGANAKSEICVYNIPTNMKKQITENSAFKRYNPSWNTTNDKVVYTSEKGDKRDQIYLTDKNGSFHINLTNDTTTHNFAATWLDKRTIIYNQSPDNIMTMKIDGSHKQRVEGISTTQFKYNSATKKIAYLDTEGNLLLFDMNSKIKQGLIKQNELNTLIIEPYNKK
jgi:putative intracellular protease/amidase